MTLRTTNSVTEKLPRPEMRQLAKPPYTPDDRAICNVGLAVESMKDHVTDEGYQLFKGLEANNYYLEGYNLGKGFTHIPTIMQIYNPKVLVLQDKREWDVSIKDFRERRARFSNSEQLKNYHGCFKLTIIKDAHQRPDYHREAAEEIGCHAWITYYHPKIVTYLATYIRPEHLIRVYHSIDPGIVPNLETIPPVQREPCILSGAISAAYPLRTRLLKEHTSIPEMTVLQHPGYHRNGCNTQEYIRILSQYKVAICTSSIYGYSLRKIIEATAAGCRVITDLPIDDILPTIDHNLYRVPSGITTPAIRELVRELVAAYNYEEQLKYSERAKWFYDYRFQGKLLAESIESMRMNYNV